MSPSDTEKKLTLHSNSDAFCSNITLSLHNQNKEQGPRPTADNVGRQDTGHRAASGSECHSRAKHSGHGGAQQHGGQDGLTGLELSQETNNGQAEACQWKRGTGGREPCLPEIRNFCLWMQTLPAPGTELTQPSFWDTAAGESGLLTGEVRPGCREPRRLCEERVWVRDPALRAVLSEETASLQHEWERVPPLSASRQAKKNTKISKSNFSHNKSELNSHIN